MGSHRISRVSSLLRQEISGYINREIRDSSLEFSSITRMNISKDLHYARVFVSVMSAEDVQQRALEVLNKLSSKIRSYLYSVIHIKTIPQLEFVLDQSLEKAAEIYQILDNLNLSEEIVENRPGIQSLGPLNTVEEVADLLRTLGNILIIAHQNPDGDNIGSTLALSMMVSSLGIDSVVVNRDPIPPRYFFLTGAENIQGLDYLETGVKFDAVFILDTGDPKLTGYWPKLSEIAPILVTIDHHLSSSRCGHYNCIDETASSTCEIILRLAEQLEIYLSPELARSIYTGITTDTGSFGFTNTSPDTHRAAARLMESGFDLQQIITNIYMSERMSRVRMKGVVLGALQFTGPENKIGYSVITLNDMEKWQADAGDLEQVINLILQIEGVEIAVLFRQLGPVKSKLSLRAKTSADVQSIASQFGGGGHRKAAAAVVDRPYQELIPEVLEKSIQAL